MSGSDLEILKLVVSILGFGGTIAALLFALRQYRRSEQWKRSEFVAREIKEFESNPTIRNALLMIDWGERRINLFLVEKPTEADQIRITREVLWRALLPHSIKSDYPSHSVDANTKTSDQNGVKIRFTPVEAKIRDTFDIFLDHLERFANFIRSGLVNAEEFKPYLIYWINTIGSANIEEYKGDAEWRCTLLTYINVYGYEETVNLFKDYDKNIKPDGELYKRLGELIKEEKLFEKLLDCANNKESVKSKFVKVEVG